MLSTKTTVSPSVGSEARTQSSSSSSSSTTNGGRDGAGKKRSSMEWYEEQLHRRPVFTKMVTGGFLWGFGDAVAQLMPAVAVEAEDWSGENNTKSTANSSSQNNADEDQQEGPIQLSPAAPPAAQPSLTVSKEKYDWPRTMRAVVFGFAIHAPTSHLHFNFLEWMTVRAGVTGGVRVPIFKAFMEQFVYWSWISNSMYHGAMGAMQGLNLTQICHRISDVLWETQKAQWVFWIPVQLLNFRFVPVRHQLNVVLLVSIAWTALLSAWYPPEKNNTRGSCNPSQQAEDGNKE